MGVLLPDSTKSYGPEWSDEEFKESIKERDGHRCMNPNCTGVDSRLCLHHIDYNKQHCEPQNVITTCWSCNIKANHNQDFWTGFYREIMNREYSYIYEKEFKWSGFFI